MVIGKGCGFSLWSWLKGKAINKVFFVHKYPKTNYLKPNPPPGLKTMTRFLGIGQDFAVGYSN